MSFVEYAIFATTFVVVFVALIIFELLRRRRYKQRFESVRILTDPANISQFIAKIDDDIAKTNNSTHADFLQMNRSTGLFYKGEWDAAVELLESIDTSAMPREFRALYYNNLLASKLLLGEIDDANGLYTGHLASLSRFMPDQYLNVALGVTIGALEYHNGELPRSKLTLEYVLCLAQAPLHKAATHYFLGLIAESEDDHIRAVKHFNEAIVAGVGSWISESAGVHSNSLNEAGKKSGVAS